MHNITTYKDQSKPWGIKHYWAACLLYYDLCAEYIISCSFISFLNRKLFGFLLIQTQNSFGSHFKISWKEQMTNLFFFKPTQRWLLVCISANQKPQKLLCQRLVTARLDIRSKRYEDFFRTIFLRYIVIFLANFQF